MLRSRRTPSTALFLVAAFTLAACGGDDSSSPTTAAPETTAAPDTTAAAPDTTEAAPDTTPAPETTEAVVEFATFTTDELVAALPAAADLGPDWVDLGGTPLVDPPVNEGPGFGNCGGPNQMGRATQAGVVTAVQGPNLQLPSDMRRASTSIYVFADDVSATDFLDLNYQLIECPDGIEWEWIQRSNPVESNEFNGFGPGFEGFADGATWFFSEFASSEYDAASEDVLLSMVERSSELTAVQITFSQTDTTLVRLERFDNVVIATQITGSWNFAGYLNLDTLVPYEPDPEHLVEYANTVLPLVLERLGWE